MNLIFIGDLLQTPSALWRHLISPHNKNKTEEIVTRRANNVPRREYVEVIEALKKANETRWLPLIV